MNAAPTPPTRAARIGSALWGGFWLIVALGFAYRIVEPFHIHIPDWGWSLIATVFVVIVFAVIGILSALRNDPQKG